MAEHSEAAYRYWMGGKRAYAQDRFFEESLDSGLWQHGHEDDWHACWYTGMPKPSFFSRVGPDRRINHIPGNNALTVKSRLHDSLVTLQERVRAQQPDAGERLQRLQFLPRVYSMPGDYHALQQAALDNPEKRWILKPKNASKGKGIELVRDVASVPMEASWMVQEYVENPHTMHGRKYVLRLYVLVASVSPLRVYLYRQGFAKLASAPYDEANADNPYSYLTNPDINALNLDAEVPVEFVEFEAYRQWLRAGGHDDDALFRKIEDMVTLTCISAVETMRDRTVGAGVDPRGCYELLGIDCLVDDQLHPWILECNLSPSLDVCAGPEDGGVVEEGVKRAIVADMVELVGLNSPPESPGDISPEAALVAEAEQELARAGGFQRLYPGANAGDYLPYFALARLPDWVLAQALTADPLPQPMLRRHQAEAVISDDQVHVYDTESGRLHALNETASLIWLLALDGAGPDQIADALVESARKAGTTAVDAWSIRNDVWNALADWARAGLLVQTTTEDAQHPAPAAAPAPASRTGGLSVTLDCGGFATRFRTDSAAVAETLAAVLRPMESGSDADTAARMEVVRDTPGYTLILDGEVIAPRLALSDVAAAMLDCLARNAAGDGDIVLDAGLVADAEGSGESVVVINGDDRSGDATAVHLARARNHGFSRGLVLGAATDQLEALALPARIPQAMTPELDITTATRRHRLGSAGQGALVPASGTLARHSRQADTLVFADRSSGQDACVRPLSVSEALTRIIASCRMGGGRPLDGAGFRRLVHWLENCQRLAIQADSPGDGARVLMQSLDATTTVPESLNG